MNVYFKNDQLDIEHFDNYLKGLGTSHYKVVQKYPKTHQGQDAQPLNSCVLFFFLKKNSKMIFKSQDISVYIFLK